MPKFYNTPQPYGLRPVEKPKLTGKELLYKLEDDYAEYRKFASNSIGADDPAVHAKFKADIAEARKNLT